MMNNFYKNILDSLDSYIVVIKEDGLIAYSNKHWDLLIQQLNSAHNIKDNYFNNSLLLHANSEECSTHIKELIQLLFTEQSNSFTMELPNSLDGSKIWLELNGALVKENDNNYVVLNYKNIIEKKIDQQKIEELTVVDNRTGLANENSFNAFFTSEWQRSTRLRSEIALFIAELDSTALDDHALESVANVFLLHARRASDCAGILSDNKFVLVLGQVGATTYESVAHSIYKQVEDLKLYSSDGCLININIGMTSAVPALIDSSEMLFNSSNLALNKAIKKKQPVLCRNAAICLKEVPLAR